MSDRNFHTAIITALPVELAALMSLVEAAEPLRIDGDPNSYRPATLRQADGAAMPILLCMLNRMGNNSAAVAATNLMRSFGVEHFVFCGIALGVPNASDPGKHVRLGDVVVGDRVGVVQIDHRSVGPTGEINRSNIPAPPAGMMRALNELDAELILGSAPWNELIEGAVKAKPILGRPDPSTDIVLVGRGALLPHPADPSRHPDRPKLIRGRIGSSNTLVRDSEYRDEKAASYDLRAMEMESAGTLEALWNFDRSAMIVRGVCDYGVPKSDTWHRYAALAAAAVSLSLISKL